MLTAIFCLMCTIVHGMSEISRPNSISLAIDFQCNLLCKIVHIMTEGAKTEMIHQHKDKLSIFGQVPAMTVISV